MFNPSTGEELIGSEEEVNGYRFERIQGRDLAGRLVFRAVNYKHERRSIKIISLVPISVMDAAFDETIRLTDLSHPSIAQSYEFMVRKETTELLIFTQYCEENLAKCLKTLTDSELVKYAGAIIDAMVYLHEVAKMTHNDLRMESIQLSGKERIPKLTFYSIDWEDEVPRTCYMSKEQLRQYRERSRIEEIVNSKADDIWALGLFLLQLFSRKRITSILALDGMTAYEQIINEVYLQRNIIYQSLKFSKIDELIKKALHTNPKMRPTIGQFAKEFKSNLPYFRPIRQGVRDAEYRSRQKPGKSVGKREMIARNPIPEERYEEIVHNSTAKTNFNVFNVKGENPANLNIFSRSDYNITKIEPSPFINLEWLYLENNQIRKIQNLDYARLKGLNLANNLITKIEGLDKLAMLEELYLDSNQIRKIEGLQQLRNLKSLYLNGNRISLIENLQSLNALQVVSLLSNLIDPFQKQNAQAIRQLRKANVNVGLQ